MQVAALCFRTLENNKNEFLLITSRETGRWILPKGWPIDGKSDLQAALQEAWEEAGVYTYKAFDSPVGHYFYQKRIKAGLKIDVKATVYAVEVKKMKKKYPESFQRMRAWYTVDQASTLVDEPGLKSIFQRFDPELLCSKSLK